MDVVLSEEKIKEVFNGIKEEISKSTKVFFVKRNTKITYVREDEIDDIIDDTMNKILTNNNTEGDNK